MTVSRGKWKKYKIMKEEEGLASHLPETHILTEKSFWQMMDKYGQIIIKPNRGYLGKGVVMVTSIGNQEYEFHIEKKKYTVQGRNQTFDHLLNTYCLKKRYLVQQRIHLAAINEHLYDIRVMVQRMKNSPIWVVTGKLVKVAAKHFIITNYARSVLTAEVALEHSSFDVPKEEILSRIDQICLLASDELLKYYKSCRMIGFDIGLDSTGKIWIIEANLSPTISIFNLFQDKSMYNQIRTFKRGKL